MEAREAAGTGDSRLIAPTVPCGAHRMLTLLYTGCGRCRRLQNIDLLKFTRKREKTSGDVERWMAANAPEGYRFVDCNWNKRKAKFVSASGQLKFVAF